VFALALLARWTPAVAAEVVVRGRVLDDGGRPLRGATVELVPLLTHYEATLAAWRGEPDREPAARVLTDAAGAFALSAPEPGFWKTVVRAQRLVAAEYRLAPLIEESTLADLRLVRDSGGSRNEDVPTRGEDVYEGSGGWRRRVGTRAAIDAAAGQATPLRVVEDDGAAIAGALVCDVELGVPLGLTDAGGTAQIAAAGTAQRSEVVVLAPDGRVGLHAIGARKVGDGEDAVTVAMVTLPRAATLSGTVVDDRDSKPLAGAWVWTDLRWPGLGKRALSTDLLGDAGQVVRSGPSGGFEIRVPAAAQVQVTAAGHFQRAVRMGDPGGVELPPIPSGPMVIRLQPSQSTGGASEP
jgi:hypothetical protein